MTAHAQDDGERDYFDFEDEADDCPTCGGSGVLDDECECSEFEDTCCCLNPTPRACPECIRREREARRSKNQAPPTSNPTGDRCR